MRSAIVFAAAALCGALAAQNTATLAITGTVNPGQTLSVNVNSNLTGAYCMLVAGQTSAPTTFTFGFNSLVLGVTPMVVVPLGMTDATGACSLTQAIPALPANTPASFAFPNYTLTCQAVVLKLVATTPAPMPGGMGGGMGSFGSLFQTAVSNTANLVIGNG